MEPFAGAVRKSSGLNIVFTTTPSESLRVPGIEPWSACASAGRCQDFPIYFGLVTVRRIHGQRQEQGSAAVDRAAEAVGHTLGSIAGTIESLQAQHPHPVEEAREALAAGQETLAAAASQTAKRATAVIKKAKAVARRTKKVAMRARPKRSAVARATRTVRKRGDACEESRHARPEEGEARGASAQAVARSPAFHRVGACT